jgi:hypothetical protein
MAAMQDDHRCVHVLGTAGTLCIWIKGFSSMAKPLIDLTRKNIDFIWQDEHDRDMESLKLQAGHHFLTDLTSPHPHRLQVWMYGLPGHRLVISRSLLDSVSNMRRWPALPLLLRIHWLE